MNILDTLANWGRSAWNAIVGIPSDIGHGFQTLWHYVSSLHNVLYYLVGGPFWRLWWKALGYMNTVSLIIMALHKATHRVPGYIKLTQVDPAVGMLEARIADLKRWVQWQLFILRVIIQALYEAALAYTRLLVGIERNQRIAAVAAEHAAMLKAVAAALATVQREAADGYNSGLHDRLSTAAQLLNDLADRSPIVKDLVRVLVPLVVDLETIDNPLIRFGIGKLLGEIIAKLGVDKVTGDLIQRLLGPFTSGGKVTDLEGMARDTSTRLTNLEQQWADFMTSGGPEIEQAGREWKDLTSLTVDAALLALFGLAVTDPQAWATGIADTVGAVESATLDAIIGLIGKA